MGSASQKSFGEYYEKHDDVIQDVVQDPKLERSVAFFAYLYGENLNNNALKIIRSLLHSMLNLRPIFEMLVLEREQNFDAGIMDAFEEFDEAFKQKFQDYKDIEVELRLEGTENSPDVTSITELEDISLEGGKREFVILLSQAQIKKMNKSVAGIIAAAARKGIKLDNEKARKMALWQFLGHEYAHILGVPQENDGFLHRFHLGPGLKWDSVPRGIFSLNGILIQLGLIQNRLKLGSQGVKGDTIFDGDNLTFSTLTQDGEYLLAGNNVGNIFVINRITGGKSTKIVPGGMPIQYAALDSEGKALLAISKDGKAVLWPDIADDLKPSIELPSIKTRYDDKTQRMRLAFLFSPNANSKKV